MKSAGNQKNHPLPCAWSLQRRVRKAQPELLSPANNELPKLFTINKPVFPRFYTRRRAPMPFPGSQSACGLTKNFITLAWPTINTAVCGFVARRNPLAFIQAVLAESEGLQQIANWVSTINLRDQVYSKAITEPQSVE